MKLNNLLKSIFNAKNYKYIILFLLALTLTFLFCGNYNLTFVFKEGLTLDETFSKNSNTLIQAQNSALQTNISNQKTQSDSQENLYDCGLNKETMQNMDPSLCTVTDYNVSNIGTPNNGASKTLTNIQNVQNNLKSQNQLCTNSTSVII